MRTSGIVGGAAALLLAAGTFVAFADSGRTGLQSRSATQPRAVKAAAAGEGLSAPEASASDGARPAGITPAQARVVKTATLTLSVGRDSVTKVADGVARAAEARAGYLADTTRDSGDAQSATLTVRVPAAAFTDTLAQLRKLGRVKSESLSGKDVTGSLVDLDARLRSLRAQESALNALMAKANTVGETLQVAQSLGDVRTQIEQLAGQQAQLVDQADLATITVTVLGPHASVPDDKPQPLLVRSFSRAGAGALAVIGGVVVVLGYALPMLVLVALGLGAWRTVNRRRAALGPAREGA
ncbi:MAG: hypothetical protein QOJ00_2211 [Actinomycetota bacterium]